jgi:HlyD family secretion protein
MDRALPDQLRTKRKGRTILLIGVSVLTLALLTSLLRASLTTSLKKSAITTAVVGKGDIENTINATGEVLPEFEEVITSPINASIQKVGLDAGSEVKAGQSILTLDKAASEIACEKLKFQLESKHNSIQKLKLELDKSYYDIQSNNNIKQLHINSLQASVENAKRLFKAGGGTREDIEQAELNLKVALLEKQQLENEITSKQQTMRVEMRESEIEAEIQQNDLSDLERKLRLANIVASRAGVVTWVNRNIGSAIKEGESLARIADLGSFKVAGSIADSYIDQLRNGMPAIIRINETQIRGRVINIYPSVQNSIVSFDIQLDERNHKLFRPNMKVDVFLVTSRKNDVLRIANGPAFKGPPLQDIFVLGNGRASRRTVHIGMTNFDYVEIMDNVQPGDSVITSDMSEYKNAKEIIINN